MSNLHIFYKVKIDELWIPLLLRLFHTYIPYMYTVPRMLAKIKEPIAFIGKMCKIEKIYILQENFIY